MWPQPGRKLLEERVDGLVDEIAWRTSGKGSCISSYEYQKRQN